MMITIDKQNAAEWIERFLDGATTNEEEQALYHFFANDDVPGKLKKYKPMFDWYAGGMKESLPQPRKHRSLHLTILRLAIAAAIVLAFGVGIRLYTQYEQQKEYACYEGSYIIRNGKKITDMKTIMPVIKKTVLAAERQEKEIHAKSAKHQNSYEKSVEQQALDNLPDDETREMVKKMMND